MDLQTMIRTAKDAAPYVMAVLTATTVLAHALARAARAFERWAATTPATWDDKAAQHTRRVADGFAWVCDRLSALLPRVSFGRPAPVPRKRLQPPPMAGSMLVMMLAFCAGCSASAAAQHARLNALTTVADPTYAEAVELCDTLRDRIVAREGTTYEEDRADMDAVHSVCDPMVAGFEALRGSQLTARAAIDAGLGGAATEAIRQALALWPEVQQLVERIRSQGGDTQ